MKIIAAVDAELQEESYGDVQDDSQNTTSENSIGIEEDFQTTMKIGGVTTPRDDDDVEVEDGDGDDVEVDVEDGDGDDVEVDVEDGDEDGEPDSDNDEETASQNDDEL